MESSSLNQISENSLLKGASILDSTPIYAGLTFDVMNEFFTLRDRFNTAQASKLYNPKEQTVTSNTGELLWNFGKGKVKVDTASTQGVVGFIGGEPQTTANMRIDTSTAFASVVLTTLDSSIIGNSERLLLVATARSENTGVIYNPTRTRIVSPGKAPILMEPVIGTVRIQLANSAKSAKAYVLDPKGHRKGEAEVSLQGSELKIQLSPNDKSPWYEIVVER